MSDASQGPGWWMASDGKWYAPQTGSPPPPPSHFAPVAATKKGHGCLYAILGAVGLVVVIGIVLAVVVGTAAKKVSDNAKAGNLGGAAPAVSYKVGDTATTSGFQVTVYAVHDPQPPGQFETPPAGSHFVAIDVQITNPKSTQQSFSSLIAFHMLDAQNHQWGENLSSAIEPGPPEGEIAAGQSIRGWVTFVVGDASNGLKLRVQGSLTAAGAVFALS